MSPIASSSDVQLQGSVHTSIVPAPSDRSERTHELLTQAVAADQGARDHLHQQVVLLNLQVARSIVMRYRNRGVPTEDLVQIACVGLVKAVRGFDAAKGSDFLSYATPTILGEVKRFFRDNSWMVKPPRRIQDLQAEISAATTSLMQRTAGVPTAADIADELGLDVSAVIEALAADGCFSPASLDRPITSDDDSGVLADGLGSHDPGFEQVEALVALAPVCRRLCARDQRIVYLRFFQEWTQDRIAEELGVTQMQISRLLARILRDLRTELVGQQPAACEASRDGDLGRASQAR